MPTRCFLLSQDEHRKLFDETGKSPPGAVIPLERSVTGPHAQAFIDNVLSPEYKRDWLGKRPPLLVILPCGHGWNVDARASGGDRGWTVTGEPPDLTATPSIDCVGCFHGWLRNGVISDDLEGRKYG